MTSLEMLDVVLNGYYRAARERSQDREKLQLDQTAWLNERNACLDTDCLHQTYHRRIMELAAVPAKAEIQNIKYEMFDGLPSYILTRENGLKHFDGGVSDYDVVAGQSSKYDVFKDCSYRSYYLIGTRKTIKTRCMKNQQAIYQPAISEDGKAFQLIIAYEPESKHPEDPSTTTLLDGTRIVTEHTERIWPQDEDAPIVQEVFPVATKRIDAQGKVLWKWVTIRRNLNWVAGEGVPNDSRKYNFSGGKWLPLADGSILGIGYRYDPQTGLPYDRTNIRVFSVEQALSWRSDWIRDYTTKTPACQSVILHCPDKKAASRYLLQRFDEEMDRQFAAAKYQDIQL